MIVTNIQTLLQSMRLSEFNNEFLETIKSINSVVNNLLTVSEQHLQDDEMRHINGQEILEKLKICNERLGIKLNSYLY